MGIGCNHNDTPAATARDPITGAVLSWGKTIIHRDGKTALKCANPECGAEWPFKPKKGQVLG